MKNNIEKLVEYYHMGWESTYDDVLQISDNELRTAYNLGRLDSEEKPLCVCTPSEDDNEVINKLISLV